MKNEAMEVKNKIDKLHHDRAADLAAIEQKKSEAQAKLEAAQQAIRSATEQLDLNMYEKSRADEQRAKVAINMYDERHRQLQSLDYLTEEESNGVINGLLDYEEELSDAFRQDIREPLQKLKVLYSKYAADVKETENVLREWTGTVHPYYISTQTSRTLPDGTVTNRMDTPQPVHRVPYKGCDESVRLGEYLAKEKTV